MDLRKEMIIIDNEIVTPKISYCKYKAKSVFYSYKKNFKSNK